MLPDGTATVLDLRSRAVDRAHARALAALEELAVEALAALDDVIAGDVDAIYSAHRAVNRAVAIAIDNRLRTTA